MSRASRGLGLASEACLSLEAGFEHLRRRIGGLRLAADAGVSRAHAELRELIEDDIDPTFERALESALEAYAARGVAADAMLGERGATLSPSDFGFHNARRNVDGSLVFLDFEHFGWDDPAKMVSDFLLHPGFALGTELRAHFLDAVRTRHSCGEAIAWRVPVVLPLHALKWTTILLNEFVSEHRDRRDHANHLLGPDEGRLDRQLEKARRMIATAKQSLLHPPTRTTQTQRARFEACTPTGS